MKIPVANRKWVVTLAHAARATSGSSSRRRGVDDRARVVLVGRVAGGRVLASIVGRQHDVLTKPQRFESGLVGGCRQLHELGAGDVVHRQPDAQAHRPAPARRSTSITICPFGRSFVAVRSMFMGTKSERCSGQRLLSALLPPTITAMTTPMAVTNDITRAMAATRGYPPLPQ